MSMATLDGYLHDLLTADNAPAAAAAAAASMPASSDASPLPQVSAESPSQMPVARARPGIDALIADAPVALPDRGLPVHRGTPHMPARARTATGGNRWLRVGVGRDTYAFELLRVQEVVRVAPVVAMRGAGHAVLGVMNLRGRIVPVLDLGLWLDAGAVHADDRARIVVIERDDELIGLLVTTVEDVVSLDREHVEPPLAGTDPGPTLGVARISDWPTVLLDADALFV